MAKSLRSDFETIATIIGILGGLLPLITIWWRIFFILMAIGALVDKCFLRPLASSQFSSLNSSHRVLASYGAMVLIVGLLWVPLLKEYRTEHPIPSLVYVVPTEWKPESDSWSMRVMQYGPNPVYNIRIYLEDDNRVEQLNNQATPLC
jgi:hypothetical protein